MKVGQPFFGIFSLKNPVINGNNSCRIEILTNE